MRLGVSVRGGLGAAVTSVLLVAAGVGFVHRSEGAVTDTGVVNVDTNLGFEHASASGTGVVLTPSGRVLTNNHVIRGATIIRVTDPATRRSYSATVLGYSVMADIALLQLKGASHLRTVSIGDSSRVRIGQPVTAIGNAGGVGGIPSRATGEITGLRRSITVSDGEGASAHLTDLIEIDAALEPGDSGGPLLDSSGRAIGIDAAASVGFRFTGHEGYAIPINRALAIVKQIKARRASDTVHIGPTPFLGLSLAASRAGLGTGPFVAGVADGSPADRAGILVGSLITRINGLELSTRADLVAQLLRHKVGATVTLRWIDRAGKGHAARIKTTAGPPQ